MKPPFYVWEDVNDPYSTGPTVGYDGNLQFKTKILAKRDFADYAKVMFGPDDWKPKLQISCEKVKA